MRLAILAVFLASAACSDPGYGDDGGIPTGGSCENDSDCSGDNVCARDGECISPDYVRSLKVFWQINGGAANATTCVDPDLSLDFFSNQQFDTFGFAPVPCKEGQFFLDKIPTRYNEVEIYNTQQTVVDDELVEDGEVHLNLQY